MGNVVAQLLIGLAVSLLVGGLGYRLRVFTRGSVIAVAGAGAAVFALSGWAWGMNLVLYFLGLVLVSRYGRAQKGRLLERSRPARRWNGNGILGNSLWAVVLALMHAFAPTQVSLYAAFLGAVAAATSDGWATELGVLSNRAPRLITTQRRVAPGTPGAISMLGVVAALSGAWFAGFVGVLASALRAWFGRGPLDRFFPWLLLSATAGGLFGCLTDSLLGATAQGVYYCERCEKESETRVHVCGEQARQIRGWSWLTNESIDLVGSVVGAAVAAGIAVSLARNSIWW